MCNLLLLQTRLHVFLKCPRWHLSHSHCEGLTHSTKESHGVNVSDYWKVERCTHKRSPSESGCTSIDAATSLICLVSLPEASLTSKMWAERKQGLDESCFADVYWKKKTKQTPKECRIGLKQTVCAVPPFMPSPGQFISSNVGAAGQKSLFSVGLAMLSVHIVDPSAACTQHIQWKIKSSAPHCTRL